MLIRVISQRLQATFVRPPSSPPFLIFARTMADAEYVIEYARSGRSGCKKCKEKIDKGSPRIGKETSSPFSDDGKMRTWYHVKCIFDSFQRARASTKKIESTADLQGYDTMRKEEQDDVKKLIFDFLSSKKGTAAAAAAPSKNAKKSAVASDESKAVVEKKTGATGGRGPPLGTDAMAAEADNSFRQFRRLCEKLEAETSHTEKSQLVAKYIENGTTGRAFYGDPYLVFKLLLPAEAKRVYNLKNRQLVKIFSQIFQCDADEMTDFLDQNGEVSDTVASFFVDSETVKPQKKSTLSLTEVDKILDDLTTVTKEEDQEKMLKSVAQKCTAKDLKYIVRLIKHDLRLNAGTRIVLDGLDVNAYKAYNSSHDLKAIVDVVWKQKKSGGGGGGSSGDGGKAAAKVLDVTVSLMTPVKPMLAAACKSSSAAFRKCPQGMYAEIKYDGERVQIHKRGSEFSYFSRSLKPVLPHKVEHVKSYLPQACPHGNSMILDSEVLLMDTNEGKPLPFGSLSVHKKRAFQDATVCLFVFDCLFFNGQSLMDKPMKDRRSFLEKNLTVIPNRIMLSEYHHITKEAELDNLMRRAMRESLEGLVLKDVNGVYEPNKRHWLKMKKDYLAEGAMADTADLVVLGAYYGTGTKGGLMSVFLMGVYDGTLDAWKTVCKCGNGHDDPTLQKIQNELRVKKIGRDHSKIPDWLLVHRSLTPDFVVADPTDAPVWEITGAEFSKSTSHSAAGISIRFPRVTKIRDDKDWKTATSLSELQTLFKKSKEVAEGDEDDEDDGPSFFPKHVTASSTATTPRGTPQGTPKKRMKVSKSDDEPPRKQMKLSDGTEDLPEKDLPCFFRGLTFCLSSTLHPNDAAKLKRYIIAYDGDIVEEYEKDSATHFVTNDEGGEGNSSSRQKKVSFEWVWQCIEKQKLL